MDETKKALLSIELDTAALTQNAEKAKETVKALAEQLKELKAAGKESGEAFDKITEQLKKAGEEAKKSREALKEYGKGLSETAKAAGELKSSIGELSAQHQKNALDTTASAASLDILKLRYSASKNEVSELRSQLKELETESAALTEAHGKNSTEVKALQGAISGLNAQIKNTKADSLEYKQAIDALKASQATSTKETTVASNSIADYTKNVLKAAESHTPFGKTIGEMVNNFNTVKDGAGKVVTGFTNYKKEVSATLDNSKKFNSDAGIFAKSLEVIKVGSEVATGGVKNFTKALAGTGIGLIIVAVAALIDYLKKFQPIVDLVEQVMAGFNGALAAGKHVLDEFFGSIKSVGDLFSKFGDFLHHPLQSIKNLANTMAEAAQKTFELKRAQQELDEESQRSVSRNSERESELARLKYKMLGASLADRKNYEKQIKTIEDSRFAESQHLQEKQVNITLARVNAINKLNKDEIFDINNLTEAKIAAVAKSHTLDVETVKSLREALKQRDDSRKEFFEKEAKDAQQAQAKQTEQQQKNKEAAQKHDQDLEAIQASKERMKLAAIHDSYEKQVAEININFDHQKQQYKGHTQVLAQLQKERDQQLADLKKQHRDTLANEENAKQKALLDKQQEAEIKAAGDKHERVFELRTKQIQRDLNFELNQIGLSEEQKKNIIEKYEQQQSEAKKTHDEAVKASYKKDLENKLEADEQKLKGTRNNDKENLKAQQQYLEDKRKLDIENANGNKKDLEKIDEQYQKDKQHLADQENKILLNKAKNYADHFSKLAGLFGKNTQISKAAFQAQKAIAVAEIAINTEKQVSASISATKNQIVTDSKFGFPLGTILVAKDIALGVIDVATTIAGGAKQIATINGTNVQGLARGGLYLSDSYGGMVKGPGHGTSDSINARLSNGESVINARSTEMFAPILSAINQAGGGRAFNTSSQSNGYALGGIFSGSNTLNDSSNDLANARALNDMAKTMAANMPRQILVVEDVQASLQNRAMLQSMSNF